MKITLENSNWLENRVNDVHDMPKSHTEGLDAAQLEKLENLHVRDAAVEVGKKVFAEHLQSNPGKLAAFRELEKDGDAEQFANHYRDYMTDSGRMKKNDPEMYSFMKERIFGGNEYPKRPGSQSISFTNRMGMPDLGMVHDPSTKKGSALQ